MARIEMKNLRSFPMEKLCFDLKLEALEKMEPRDVCELAKVNQGFQGMLVRDPSIILGEHVSRIQLGNYQTIWIKKFSNSNKMELNDFSRFSFVKKIRSCDHVSFWMSDGFNENYRNTFLKNLKSVNKLLLYWFPGVSFGGSTAKEALKRFFSDFHASIKEKAGLDMDGSAFNDQVIKDWIENFMVAPQLKDCEKIWFACRTEDSVRFCYNALLKAEIKNVSMGTYSSRCIDWIIQQIITSGIPGKKPEASIFLDSHNFDITIELSQYPGMRRIHGENRFRLLKQANHLARMNFRGVTSDGATFFREESSMFRRLFDSTKDCICVYDKRSTEYFLAFYVPIN